MLHSRGSALGAPRRAYLAMAAYQGVSARAALALYEGALALQAAGIDCELGIFSENCHVDDARNLLVSRFLKSTCTDLVFLDSDVGYPGSQLVDLLGYDRDIVAGIYPLKEDGAESYPVRAFPGELRAAEDGLVEVEAVPTGFLRIRRRVLEKLDPTVPHFRDKAGNVLPQLFERVTDEGQRRGGDYQFCFRAREAGYKVWVAPEMRFDHEGSSVWTGSLGWWWRKVNNLALPRIASVLEAKYETEATLQELVEAWGNPKFSVTAEFLAVLLEVLRDHPRPPRVLEMGSGLTTWVAAAIGCNVTSLEESPAWREQTAERLKSNGLFATILTPGLQGTSGWYDLADGDLHGQFDVILVDGPKRPRQSSGQMFPRQGVAELERHFAPGARILVDDAEPAILEPLSERLGVTFHTMGEQRPFAVARLAT